MFTSQNKSENHNRNWVRPTDLGIIPIEIISRGLGIKLRFSELSILPPLIFHISQIALNQVLSFLDFGPHRNYENTQ